MGVEEIEALFPAAGHHRNLLGGAWPGTGAVRGQAFSLGAFQAGCSSDVSAFDRWTQMADGAELISLGGPMQQAMLTEFHVTPHVRSVVCCYCRPRGMCISTEHGEEKKRETTYGVSLRLMVSHGEKNGRRTGDVVLSYQPEA